MKRIISILCVAVLLVSALSLSSCGKKKHEEIHGTYTLTKVMMSKTDRTKEYEGAKITFDGGTATMNINGIESELKVDYDKSELTNDNTTYPFTVEGDTVTVTGDGKMIMTFEKE